MKTNLAHFPGIQTAAAGLLLTLAPFQMIYAAPQADEDKKSEAATEEAKQEEEKSGSAANGRVFSIEPELLSVVVEGSTTPLQFKVDKDTPYVDETGKVVSVEMIRKDLPLTVHYTGTGEKLNASKVVVTRSMVDGATPAESVKKREAIAEKLAEKETEAQKTGSDILMGTVAGVEQTITVQQQGEENPRSFVINNSTRYVNTSGQPVSSDLVFSGMPISIKSVSDGTRQIAQLITVRGNAQQVASGQYPNNQNGGQNGGVNGNTEGGANGNASTGTNGGTGTVRTTTSSTGGGADYTLPINGVNNNPIVGPYSGPVNPNGITDPSTGAGARINGNSTGLNGNNNQNQGNNGATNGTNGVTNGNGATNPNAVNPNNNPSGNLPSGTNQPSSDNQPNGNNTTSPVNGTGANGANATNGTTNGAAGTNNGTGNNASNNPNAGTNGNANSNSGNRNNANGNSNNNNNRSNSGTRTGGNGSSGGASGGGSRSGSGNGSSGGSSSGGGSGARSGGNGSSGAGGSSGGGAASGGGGTSGGGSSR